MAEHRFHFLDVPSVFSESMIVGNGLGFRVDEEFIGIATSGFAEKSGAPLAKDGFQFFLGVRGELFDGFDGESAEGTFCNFTNAGNLANRKRSQEARASIPGGTQTKPRGFACSEATLATRRVVARPPEQGRFVSRVMVRRSLSAAASGGP